MIIQEQISEELIRSYSDLGVKIHGGYPEADYDEAIDSETADRTYTETDIPITDEDATAEELLDILLGGDGA